MDLIFVSIVIVCIIIWGIFEHLFLKRQVQIMDGISINEIKKIRTEVEARSIEYENTIDVDNTTDIIKLREHIIYLYLRIRNQKEYISNLKSKIKELEDKIEILKEEIIDNINEAWD